MNPLVGTYVAIEGSIGLMASGHHALPEILLVAGAMRDTALIVEVLLLIAVFAATSSSSFASDELVLVRIEWSGHKRRG